MVLIERLGWSHVAAWELGAKDTAGSVVQGDVIAHASRARTCAATEG
jgi:hypothetical protein